MKTERGGVVGGGRTIGGEGDSAKGGPSKCLVSYHPVVQGIAYECRAIERSVCDQRGRARTSWRRPRDQRAVCNVAVCRPDMRLSEVDSRRVASRETPPGTT